MHITADCLDISKSIANNYLVLGGESEIKYFCLMQIQVSKVFMFYIS